jgi:hypothetical protein
LARLSTGDAVGQFCRVLSECGGVFDVAHPARRRVLFRLSHNTRARDEFTGLITPIATHQSVT